ncbi:MAG: sulfite exporter TauE/SafE family protein, partial [Patescibacteria group bacterium]
ANTAAFARMRPVFLFVAGRTLSYGILGGAIGAIGKAFTPSPLVTGALIVAAAAFMLVMGLDMLKIAPQWLKAILPRMPKALSHRIMDAEGKEHPVAPLLLGAGTFFLPCGFTQSLQLYALTTGSFLKSALVLGAFALGTAPALLALGWASSSLKGKAGKLFFQFSGALVIVLGLWNIQNGFTVAGYPLSLPDLRAGAAAAGANAGISAPNVVGGQQLISMDVGGPKAPYDPDTLTVKTGVPVRWEINGVDVAGCISYLQSRKLGIGIQLRPGLNVVEFTPPAPGTYSFSCSMGMFRGTINVIP